MILKEKITALARLGDYIDQLLGEEQHPVYGRAEAENPWFIFPFVKAALAGIREYLFFEKLARWTGSYSFGKSGKKRIGLILAGNIPLVGFHDLLCVLLAGHTACLKMSHQDQVLMDHLIAKLLEIEPRFHSGIKKVSAVEDAGAVIATGSDNSARYFYAYYQHLPHLIRKNRTSVAVLDGNETAVNLEDLATDIFLHFGLGCRNVSRIFIPERYDPEILINGLTDRFSLMDHRKYRNNYVYQRSMAEVLNKNYRDGGYFLLQESENLVSPLSVLYYSFYNDIHSLKQQLMINREKIQAVVSHLPGLSETVPFGRAQFPAPWDYADQVDTLDFLLKL
jgi:hypothetical protein